LQLEKWEWLDNELGDEHSDLLDEPFSIRQNPAAPEPVYFIGNTGQYRFLGKINHLPFTDGSYEELIELPDQVVIKSEGQCPLNIDIDAQIIPFHHKCFGTLLVLFGGGTDLSVWIYSISLRRFFRLKDLPRPVYRPAVHVYHNYVYVIAGYGRYENLQLAKDSLFHRKDIMQLRLRVDDSMFNSGPVQSDIRRGRPRSGLLIGPLHDPY